MKCSACQTESTGAYCPSCGAPLEGARCKACEAPLVAGARFCNQCGAAVRAASSGTLPWVVAGVAVAGLVATLALSAGHGGDPAGPAGAPFAAGAAGGVAGGAPSGTPPPLTGTPREQADRLFNRVMQAASTGDTAQVRFFVPMAVMAYRQAGALDADGLYHLSVLETHAGEWASARSTAERILADEPGHLLALGAAARAARSGGEDGTARRYYERLLEAFPAERERGLVEYLDHARILPEYRTEAESFLGR